MPAPLISTTGRSPTAPGTTTTSATPPLPTTYRKRTRQNSRHRTTSHTASTTTIIPIAQTSAPFPYTTLFRSYDGDPHTAGGTSKGVKAESLSGLDLSHTTHTNAGTFNLDYWSFTDSTGNYNNVGNTTITDHISKADTTELQTPNYVAYRLHHHYHPHRSDLSTLSLHDALPILRRRSAHCRWDV